MYTVMDSDGSIIMEKQKKYMINHFCPKEINNMKYRLVEENTLRRLIEGNMIYEELCAQGVDNWTGSEFVHYPDVDEIEQKLNHYNSYEEVE